MSLQKCIKPLLLCSLFFIGILITAAQERLPLLGQLSYPERLNDVWGYEAPDGIEYALVGTLTGTSIVNVSETPPREVHFIQRDSSIWRDIKVFNHHAYVTNETGGGLLIINLSQLPESIDTVSWVGDKYPTPSAHNIFIDEQGIGYITGHDYGNSGLIMVDLKVDPMNPTEVGLYDDHYVHDCFARNDTLYTAEFNAGRFSVIDIKDKANPIVLARQTTPGSGSHNVWLSNDGRFLFNSDERVGQPVTSYDISDLNDIKELDRYYSSPGGNNIPHNAFYLDGFLINSYYRDGVVILDVSNPENMVEVAHYDTSPLPPAGEFQGCWGVYPYFKSGKILATDIEEGLFVLEGKYPKAAYINGAIKIKETKAPLVNAQLRLEQELDKIYQAKSDITGRYTFGAPKSGLYTIRITHPYCDPLSVDNVDLYETEIKTLDFELSCSRAWDRVNIEHRREQHQLIIAIPDDLPTEHLKIEVFTVSGQVLFSKEQIEGSQTVDLSQLANGTYLVKVSNSDEFRVFKFSHVQ